MKYGGFCCVESNDNVSENLARSTVCGSWTMSSSRFIHVSPENNVSPKNIRVGTILIIVSLLTMLPYSFLPAFGPLYLRPANRSISVLVHVSDLVRRLYHPSSQPFLLYKRSETEQLQVFFFPTHSQSTHKQSTFPPNTIPTSLQPQNLPLTIPQDVPCRSQSPIL